MEENLKALVEIEESILDNVNKLKLLEAKGKINSIEFKSVINTLINQRLLENSLFTKAFENKEFANSFLFGEAKFINNLLIDSLKSIERNNKRELVKNRILIKLNNSSSIIDLDSLKEYGIDFTSIKDVCNAIYDDICLTITYLLNTYINNYNYGNVKDDIIGYKYNMIFMNDSILDSLLSKGYSDKDILYWSHMLYYSNKTESQIIFTRTSSASDMLKEYMTKIAFETDTSLIVFYECVIRTAFLFFSKEDYETFKNEFYKIIEDKKEQFDDIEEVLDVSAFERCVNYYESDLELPNILSLSKQKN